MEIRQQTGQQDGDRQQSVDLALQLAHLLLERVAGLLRLIHGSLHGGDLLVAFRLLGQGLARQVFVVGVQGLTRAVLPLLRLAHVFLIFGVQPVIVAHGHGGRLHGFIQFVLHVRHGLPDGRVEGGILDGAHAFISLAAGDAAGAIENIR